MRCALLLALLLAALQPTAASAVDRGDSLAQALAGEHAKLSVLWVASPGWAEAMADGQPDGLTVAILRRFSSWLNEVHGLRVELDFIEETDWRRFYARVRDAEGGVFGLGNVTITAERARELAFSPPYVDNVAVLISRGGHEPVETPEALAERLAGQHGLAFAGTLHERRLRALTADHWPGLVIDTATSNAEILDIVAAGTHFGYIDGYAYLRSRAEGLDVMRHPALDDGGEHFGIIMPLNNDWQELLAAFFADGPGLIHSDWYRAAMIEHLGEELAELLAP